MKAFTLYEGELPGDVSEDFEPFLFNSQRHLRSQRNTSLHSFYLADSRRIVALVHFEIAASLATSLPYVPFGSVEFSPDLDAETVMYFVEQVELRLRQRSISRVMIKMPPQRYQQNGLLLKVILLNADYHLTQSTPAACISVDSSSYRSRIKSNELRRLRKCERALMQFRPLPSDELKTVYDFVVACREERQHSLSMEWEALNDTVRHCPDDFFLFAIMHDDIMIAASIAVRINRQVLYHFYPGHLQAYNAFSPMVMLIDGIYSWCQYKGITLFDLGTSALPDGHPDPGLLNFKRNAGGVLSDKLTFEKELN